jgi:hypothetical protein
MYINAIEVVRPKGTVWATRIPRWVEHEMIDNELMPAGEQLRQTFRLCRAVEHVVLLDALPREFAALPP